MLFLAFTRRVEETFFQFKKTSFSESTTSMSSFSPVRRMIGCVKLFSQYCVITHLCVVEPFSETQTFTESCFCSLASRWWVQCGRWNIYRVCRVKCCLSKMDVDKWTSERQPACVLWTVCPYSRETLCLRCNEATWFGSQEEAVWSFCPCGNKQ